MRSAWTTKDGIGRAMSEMYMQLSFNKGKTSALIWLCKKPFVIQNSPFVNCVLTFRQENDKISKYNSLIYKSNSFYILNAFHFARGTLCGGKC